MEDPGALEQPCAACGLEADRHGLPPHRLMTASENPRRDWLCTACEAHYPFTLIYACQHIGAYFLYAQLGTKTVYYEFHGAEIQGAYVKIRMVRQRNDNGGIDAVPDREIRLDAILECGELHDVNDPPTG